jgi:ribulose-phosphate 3-epimerase
MTTPISEAAMDRTDLLSAPPRLPLVGASLLSADWSRLGEEARGAIDAGVDLLHIDVMDGHFVPNLAFGPDVCRGLRGALPDAFLDVHLMVTDPGHFLPVFADAGADCVSFHAEVVDPARAHELAREARELGVGAALAINPPTDIAPWLEHLHAFDMLLVMSVNPGYSGQTFIREVLAKARAARDAMGPDFRIEIDGGVGPGNAEAVREAGVDILAAASAIFGQPEQSRAGVIAAMRGEG